MTLQCLGISKGSASRNWYSATVLRNSHHKTDSCCIKIAMLSHNHHSWRSITPAAALGREIYGTSPPAGHCTRGKGITAWQTAVFSAKSSAPFPGYKNWISETLLWWPTTHFHTGTDIHRQISTARISPSVQQAKRFSWGFPFKPSFGRREVQCCPITCVFIPKLHSRTSRDELLWIRVQTQVEKKDFYILTSQQSFSLFQFQ